MRAPRAWCVLVAAALGACATGIRGGAGAITRLEHAHRSNPRSEPALRSLGIAYYSAGRLPEARALLDSAVRLNHRDGAGTLYLGLTAEAQHDIAAARAAYGTYMRYGRTRRIRYELEARLAALQREEIEQQARQSLQQEQTLTATAGAPNVIAVMPLSFSGSDTTLAPLGRGLAELLTTDLARVSQLTVVERLRIQALLDELALQHSGATDSATNVRAGQILQAGRLVEGSILQQGPRLRVDAAVIDVPTSRLAGSADDDRALEQLLLLEKNIALDLLQQMQITPTTAERNAIEQRPTRSLAAFLAFSRGLSSEDASQYDEAAHQFDDAFRMDPSFTSARLKGQQARSVARGMQMTPRSIRASLAGTAEGRSAELAAAGVVASNDIASGAMLTTVSGINPASAAAAALDAMGALTAPPVRDPVSAGTGQDNPASLSGRVQIRVQRP